MSIEERARGVVSVAHLDPAIAEKKRLHAHRRTERLFNLEKQFGEAEPIGAWRFSVRVVVRPIGKIHFRRISGTSARWCSRATPG
ncbi:hypothetical protein [Mesorhizobium sp. B2-6-2]|uniref:hypothetical protein n=1 Tax=Mesorhizobium sp. B2-6-2 TaxID=2589915 RepID=UPI00112B130A|nr:hypothetical protein [Mesorhizobium sp. B2-6-2]TPJ77215.1 hypothetical protein FJ419_17045 [Mesorhizobium sp. B2-6-2]